MRKYLLGLFVVSTCVMATPEAALAQYCRPPCANVEAGVKPSSVIPPPDQLALRGELFSGQLTTLNLASNASQQIQLGFNFQIGSQTFDSLFVNENGIVSFGSPVPTGGTPATGPTFLPVTSLTQLGVPVIAPFYADLLSSPQQTQDYTGNVVVQVGQADPYANNGSYSKADLEPAVKITWFGLTNGGPTNTGDTVYAELLLTGDNNGTNSFDFHYGAPSSPGQNGDGSIAGFALGADSFQFTGPYQDGIPTYFEFDNGRFVGPLAAVPEPATWIAMLLGFGLMGFKLRRQRRIGDLEMA